MLAPRAPLVARRLQVARVHHTVWEKSGRLAEELHGLKQGGPEAERAGCLVLASKWALTLPLTPTPQHPDPDPNPNPNTPTLTLTLTLTLTPTPQP